MKHKSRHEELGRSRLLSICSSDDVYLSFLGPYPHLEMIFKQLKMEGFLVGRWEHKNEESLKRMLTWMQEVLQNAWLLLYNDWYKYNYTSSQEVSYIDNDADSLDLMVYRESWSVKNMLLLALKTCLLHSWGCCGEKISEKPLLKSNG